MKNLVLVSIFATFLNFTHSIYAQDILFYRIEDISQINLAVFEANLNKEVTQHEAVIVLLPRDTKSIYRKTLREENIQDVKNLLVYIMQLKGKDIVINSYLMEKAINAAIYELKNKYGPSMKYTITAFMRYNLHKVENEPEDKGGNEPLPPIDPADETSPVSALFGAIIGFAIFVVAVLATIGLVKAISYKRKGNKSNVLHIYNNTPQSILSSYEKEKNDFFNGHKSKVISIIILFMMWLPSNHNLIIAQSAELNFYIDNTITKQYRSKVKNYVLQTAKFNTHYFLFGDSVRSIGILNSKFGELDSMYSKITFNDSKTSFSSLTNHAKKHKGLSVIITDGKPDYFAEDIPDYINSNNDSLKKNIEVARVPSIEEEKSTLEYVLDFINNNLVSLLIVIVYGITWIAFLLILKKKNKQNKKRVKRIIFKDTVSGETKIFYKQMKISTNNKKIFSDACFDPIVSDLEIKNEDENTIVATITPNERSV